MTKKKRRNFWCWIGMHRWDYPGGNCEECGIHDNFFDEGMRR